MSLLAAARLAWLLGALSLALTALSLLLLGLTLSAKHSYLRLLARLYGWRDKLCAGWCTDCRASPCKPRGLALVPVGCCHQHRTL
jgi:hypothetical protein